MTEAELAGLDHDRFMASFSDIFEHSAWIAEAAWKSAPFRSIDGLLNAMVRALEAGGPDAATALVRVHPDLAGKAALAGEVTAESATEQAASGLSTLTPDELAHFQQLNTAYRAKFGFPFVMAVRRSDKAAILAGFAERLGNDPETELARALTEIKAIARLRLEALIPGA